jgi:endonuclease G
MLSWAASNVDYSDAARKHTKTRKEYGGENWRLDPRVALAAPGLQIEDAHFYKPATSIDRGHIVRREDGSWGATEKEAEYGNSDTYHWTNCTPQSIAFNQSKEDGLWGKFENHIAKAVAAVGGRMVVFAGPVLNPGNPKRSYPGQAAIQVPMEFWKVVMCIGTEGAKKTRLAYGFVFDQTDAIRERGYEGLDVGDFVVYQMPIADITRKAGVVFDRSVRDADVMKVGGGLEDVRGFKGKRVQSLEEIVLR